MNENINKTQYKFVCLIPTFKPQEYWESVDKGFDLAKADFDQYNVSIDKMYFDQYNVKSFIQASDDVLTCSPDAVLLAPVFKEETISFLAKLTSQNIPFSFIDSMIPDTNFLTYYGQNSFQSGYLAAKLLLDSMTEKTEIMVVRTKRNGTEANQTISRYNGYLQYIKDNNLTDYIININVEFNENDEDFNNKLLAKTLATHPQIKGAITFNSKVYRLATNMPSNIRVVGYDILPLNVQYLKMGVIHCLIAQHPEKQAYLTVRDMCRELILNQKIKKINYMPIDILFKENIEDYINFLNY